MARGSYSGLQSALSCSGTISDTVPLTTSVATRRPARRDTPLGTYEYRHVKVELLCGFQQIDMGDGQRPFVATPEKALLDLVYLTPGGDTPDYLQGLRLQSLDGLDLDRLNNQAARASSPKLRRAADRVARLAEVDAREYGVQ